MGFTLAATAWSGILQGAAGVGTVLGGPDRPPVGRHGGQDPVICGLAHPFAAGWSVMLIFSPFPLWTAATLLVLLAGTSHTILSDALVADEAVRTRNDPCFP